MGSNQMGKSQCHRADNKWLDICPSRRLLEQELTEEKTSAVKMTMTQYLDLKTLRNFQKLLASWSKARQYVGSPTIWILFIFLEMLKWTLRQPLSLTWAWCPKWCFLTELPLASWNESSLLHTCLLTDLPLLAMTWRPVSLFSSVILCYC